MPNGIAVVMVTNYCSVTQRTALSKNHIDNAFWVSPPDHLSYFYNDSLVAAVNYMDLEFLEMLAHFPISRVCYRAESNYVRNRSSGKAAYYARVDIENLIHERPINDVIQFWREAAKLGLGKDITAFLRPSGAI